MMKMIPDCLRALLAMLVLNTLSCNTSAGDDSPVVVTVADPYIEVHTGPHRGFPIHQVVERGESVTIVKSRTNWFKVTTARGKTGWVARTQMRETLGPDGRAVYLDHPTVGDFVTRRWEMGVLPGEFGGSDALTTYVGLHFTPNISSEIRLTQATGNAFNNKVAVLSVVHQPFPEWRLSPFFKLGAGIVKTEPDTTLTKTKDRSDNTVLVGIGAYYYLSRQFMLRIEYNDHKILTSRNVNEDQREWKAGLSVFF